jgi:YggT family protein
VVALGQFIEILSYILIAAIFIRIIFSFTRPDPRNQIYAVILQITEPILAPIRSILPRTGMLDFSPMIAMFLLFFLANLGARLASGG